MDNIELFNKITVLLFKELAEHFPTECRLDTPILKEKFAITDEDYALVSKGSHSNRIGSTIRWLNDEGFLRFKYESQCSTFTGVVLSQRGFAALNLPLPGLNGEKTYLQQLRELTKESAPAIFGTAIQIVSKLAGSPG